MSESTENAGSMKTRTTEEQQADLWATVLEHLKTAAGVAFDGCHKIYILMDEDQLTWMAEEGWGTGHGESLLLDNTKQERTPEELLHIVQVWFEGACGLRFVNAVKTIGGDPDNADYEQIIEQCNPAFSEDEDETIDADNNGADEGALIEDTIPEGFWKQIDHQLDRIAYKRPDSFDKVRQILLDPAYTDIQQEINRNGVRSFNGDTAFFAGSGGDRTFYNALYVSGWNLLIMESTIHYAFRHGTSGEEITYIEGDVQRGNGIQGPVG